MLAEMTDVAEQWIAIATGLSEARTNELALVLTARGVAYQRQVGVAGLELWVPLNMAPIAAAELVLYRHENAREIGARPLVALHADFLGRDWLGAGRLDASAVSAGQWWRTVTALTVHVDLAHLGGNLAFGTFFGYFVGRYFGTGLGWLAVLLCATGANAMNAWVQGAEHRSIGASTAVFAALGLLVAYTWRRGFLRDTPWRARIAPIVAGLGLLAFTGTAGENTDLGAHLFGFIAGFAGGAALARFATAAWLRSRPMQMVSAALVALIVLVAWTVGLVAAG
jgi:membrane associated rhomboid family serine protease